MKGAVVDGLGIGLELKPGIEHFDCNRKENMYLVQKHLLRLIQ